MTPPNMKNPIHLLAFGLGSGLAKKAPGTWGTLAALPVWWFLLQGVPALPYIGVLFAGFAFGVVICEITSRDMGVHDFGGIVWDEWIGVWITLLWLPMSGNLGTDLLWLAYAFALFRFFDIIKPWPIKWLDAKVHGGFGIMIDDVIAGIFGLVVVQLTAALV
jgi:phosphatidylglycerophosphatase A